MSTLLKIEHLEVRYGDLIGVADVSLEVPAGSVVALLGSNGAGKTTTLNAIAGIAPAWARTSPDMALSVVVLPAPFEPSSATTPPAGTRSETSATPIRSP